jgi:hypothetical protein
VNDVESLQSLVVRRAAEIGGREGPLSVRQLEERSDNKVSRGVFQQIMAGTYDAKVGQRVLDGLAAALDVDLRVVEQSSGAPPSFGPFRLPDDAARLTPAQRKAVKHVVQVMVDGNAAAPDQQARVVPLRTRTVAPDERAAMKGQSEGRRRRKAQDEAEQGSQE